jgi:hypothetical protein
MSLVDREKVQTQRTLGLRDSGCRRRELIDPVWSCAVSNERRSDGHVSIERTRGYLVELLV